MAAMWILFEIKANADPERSGLPNDLYCVKGKTSLLQTAHKDFYLLF